MRSALIPCLAWCAVAAAALAPAQPVPAPFTTHQLTPTVFWIEGGGGNSGVIVGSHGVVVIDAKMTLAGGKELLADIAKITSKPVTAVILTHSDADHTGGLAAFPAGIAILATPNNKKEQEEAIAAGGPYAPSPQHLPTRLTSGDRQSVTLEGVRFELLHWAPAHTSGDLVVYLPEQKIVFTGDIITNRARPLIHRAKNGSSAGWIETVHGILGLDAERFVPGHGDVMDKAAVEQKLNDAVAERDTIKQLVAQGDSLAQIEAATGDPAPGAAGGFAAYSEVVYQELTAKGP